MMIDNEEKPFRSALWRIVAVWIISMIWVFTQAQGGEDIVQKRVDSLEGRLRIELSDSMQLEIQILITEAWVSVDAYKCLEEAHKAMLMAYGQDEMWLVPYLYNYMGMSHDDLGEYENALSDYKNAIDITEKLMADDSVFIVDYYHDLVVFLNNAGYSEFNQGNHLGALNYYLRSLEIADEYDSPDISGTYSSVSELYFNAGDLDQAKLYSNMARNSATDSASMLLDASLLGRILIAEGKLDSALDIFSGILAYHPEERTNYDKVIAYSGLAEGHLAKGEFEQAKEMSDLCLQYGRRLDNKIFQAEALAIKARARIALGDRITGEQDLNTAIQIAVETNSIVNLSGYYDIRAQHLSNVGNYRAAYQDALKASSLRDSVYGMRRAGRISERIQARAVMREGAKAEELRLQIASGQIREKNSMRFGIVMLLFAILLGVTTYLAMRRREGIKLDTTPIEVDHRYDDKLIFLKRISAAIGILLIPILVYNIIWHDMRGIAYVLTGMTLAIALHFLAVNGKLKLAVVCLLLFGYPFIVSIPSISGPLHVAILWLPAAFIILAYSIDDFRLHITNGFFALAAFIFFIYKTYNNGYPETEVRPEIEIMVGIMALGALFIALYYHRGQIFDYRFGLNKTTRFLRLIADSNPNFVFAKGLDRRYTFANKAMVDTYGIPLSGIIGKRSEDVNPGFAESEHFREDDIEVLTQGVTKRIAEEKVYTKDGVEKWLETVKQPVRDDNGVVVGMVGVASDITERRKVEIELRKSLSILEATIDSTADGLLVVDLNQNIVKYNKKFEEIWGAEILKGGKSETSRMRRAAQQLKTPEDFMSRVHEIIKDPLAKTYDRLEFKDGRIVERFSQAQTIGEKVVGRVWSFRDVTERERALQNLSKSEKKYRTSLEDNLFSIIRVRHGEFLSTNEAFSTLTGYTQEELSNITIEDVVHADDLLMFAEFIQRVKSGQQISGSLGCRVVHKDKSLRYALASVKGYYDDDGEYLESTVTIADISQLKEFESALAESEVRYRSLVEASPDGILMIDAQGNITFASQRMVEMTGGTNEQSPVGRSILDYSIPEEFDRASRDFARALTSGIPVFGRYTIRVAGDSHLKVEVGARTVQSAIGETTGVIVVVRDINEQAIAENVLRESESRYRVLFENTFDGFVILDNSGVIEDANKSALDLFKFPNIALMGGLSIASLFPEITDLQAYHDVIAGELQRSKPLRIEGRDHLNGVIFVEINLCTVPLDGTVKIACAIKDVAERVVLENKEREIQSQEIEMDALNREVASHSMFKSQKNRLLSEIKDEIEEAGKKASVQVKRILDRLNRKIEVNLSEQEDMLAFKIQFEKIHPNFFKRLTDNVAKLTDHDLKYCAYIRLNMSTQDISNLLYIEKKSVEMSKYRIKKKLGLSKDQRLSEFLRSI
jgi:PAS domain S-box-containing protein